MGTTGHFWASMPRAPRNRRHGGGAPPGGALPGVAPDQCCRCPLCAHVFFETGDTASGGEFLETWLKGFDPRAPYHVHLSWHQALFELARGHYQRALALYETAIRPAVVANSAPALNDSAALLWRVYMYSGATPPFPPEEVRDLAAPAASRHGPASEMPMLPWPSRWPAMRSPWGR